jgi:hypothetical protein
VIRDLGDVGDDDLISALKRAEREREHLELVRLHGLDRADEIMRERELGELTYDLEDVCDE